VEGREEGRQSVIRVAVYGSLRKGCHNHPLLKNSKLVKTTKIAGLEMFDLGAFPAACIGDGTIVVEVYEVDSKTLDALDALEGHPYFYRRAETITSEGTKVSVYVMRRKDGWRRKVECGDWSVYISNRSAT
jgi:gamma-glutamylcyclotransferase (GGCT)/AIG2-like uncharacterized protein YtfP